MSHRVHGMDQALAAPTWPPLDAERLAAVLARFPRQPPPYRVTWHSPRPFAASGIVVTGEGRVFVKRHDPRVRSPADLAEEHGFIDHLRAAGVPVPAVLRTHEGASAVPAADGVYEVHEHLSAPDPYRDAPSWTPFLSAGHAQAAGLALARLHGAGADYPAPARRTHLLVSGLGVFAEPDPVAALDALAGKRPGLSAALHGRDWRRDVARDLLPWHAALWPVLRDLPAQWAHGDLHASNLLWSGPGPDDAVAAILDFGLSDRTSAVFDLATAIERNAIAWLDLPARKAIARPELMAALLDGYRGNRPLSPAECRCLPAMLPLAHAGLALSELEYFHAVTGSPADADLAYHAYLLGHAAWFRGPDGQALLHHLSRLLQA